MGFILAEIVHEKIDDLKLTERLHDESHGAVVVFKGVVRNHNAGRQVQWIEYDCFVPLAETELKRILSHTLIASASIGVLVVHRIGRIEVGESSVMIGVSSVHRSQAFEVCRFLIEAIKLQLPIWKREIYKDGQSEWLSGHSLCAGVNHHDEFVSRNTPEELQKNLLTDDHELIF